MGVMGMMGIIGDMSMMGTIGDMSRMGMMDMILIIILSGVNWIWKVELYTGNISVR